MNRLPRFVCASANPGKVAEIQALLSGVVDLVARPAGLADVVEDADSLVGNARLKALALVDATGLPAIADDTGLEVDALGGRPGVHTARFAGEGCSDADNRRRLLADLAEPDGPPGLDGRGGSGPGSGAGNDAGAGAAAGAGSWSGTGAADGVAPGDRRARFRTVALVRWPDGRELAVEGTCDGAIATTERGGAGFGYDSVFVPDDGGGATFAEMGPEAKNRISHRGRAFRSLLAALRSVPD